MSQINYISYNFREFLGGFRKRKLERKRKAQEQLQKQLKEERKKIKQEVSVKWYKALFSKKIIEKKQSIYVFS